MNGRKDRKCDIYGTAFYQAPKTGWCRKVCYSTRKAAKASLKRLRIKRDAAARSGVLNIYFCDYCHVFHCGHTNRPVAAPATTDDRSVDGTPGGA